MQDEQEQYQSNNPPMLHHVEVENLPEDSENFAPEVAEVEVKTFHTMQNVETVTSATASASASSFGSAAAANIAEKRASAKSSSSQFFHFVRLMQLFPSVHPATLHSVMTLCKNDFFVAVDRLLYAKRCKEQHSQSVFETHGQPLSVQAQRAQARHDLQLGERYMPYPCASATTCSIGSAGQLQFSRPAQVIRIEAKKSHGHSGKRKVSSTSQSSPATQLHQLQIQQALGQPLQIPEVYSLPLHPAPSIAPEPEDLTNEPSNSEQ